MSHAVRGSYVFGRFRLSADGTLLIHDGDAVALAPKVLQTLLVLLQRAGEVVKKEDLQRAVWADSFVEDTGLTRNISLLRQALGDDGQRFIVTVARIGYRFAAPVKHVHEVPEATPRELGRPAPEPRLDHGQPIVGRDRELALLRAALERALNGNGGILAVAGEPGIGKTTVVERFLEDLSELWSIGRGRCSERLAGTEPHLPVLEALDELMATDPALVGVLRRVAPTWAQHVAPSLSHSADASETSLSGSPERLMRELTTFLEEAARVRPRVIVIEDLHWADLSTIDVLAHLAPRLARMRLLVLVTYRQRDMLLAQHPFASLRGELTARGQLAEMQVSLLGLDDVREYLRLAFNEDPPQGELAAVVLQRTEGNPLFMVEVVRYLRQQGRPAQHTSLSHEVPGSLQGLIDRMLRGLESTTRQLLSIAAVQGYEFDSGTLARVSGVPVADVEERLRSADQIHALVRFDREHEMPDGALSLVYRFAHVLYQDALAGSTAPSRRVEWARQIAEALTLSYAGRTETVAGALAILFETGREFWKASEFFLSTSRQASRLFAFQPATELAVRGLRCVSAARTIDPRERRQRELDLTFARLVPLASIQGYASAEIEQLTAHVVMLAEELGDVAANAAALGATWFVRMVRGECVAAKHAGTRLIALAGKAHDDVLLINGQMHSQIACHHLGQFSQAREHAVAVRGLADRVPYPDRCIGILDPVVASLSESSRNNWITGRFGQASADADAAVALGRELRHPDSLAFAWVFHAWVQGYRGDWPTCLASAAMGIAIAAESGSVQTLAWNRCVHGWALAHVGQAEKGESDLSAAIEMSKGIMGQVALPQFSVMMSEVLLARDDLASAERWLQQASEFEHSHEDRYFSAEVRRLTAVCRAKRGRVDEARLVFQEAMAVARSQGALTFELRAALSLAELDSENGRPAVRSVLSAFTEPDSWPEIAAARRTLQ